MTTITTLGTGDSGSTSRGVINTNFDNLNTNKIETSVISTDGTLSGNSDTELPTEKAVKSYVDSVVNTTVETTTGTTHSLTTTAGQVVIVTAKGDLLTALNGSPNYYGVSLNYNSVEKDTSNVGGDTDGATAAFPFCLQYTETPGDATQNITVTSTGGTLENVVIIVQIIG